MTFAAIIAVVLLNVMLQVAADRRMSASIHQVSASSCLQPALTPVREQITWMTWSNMVGVL